MVDPTLSMLHHSVRYCPACRTYEIATRSWDVVICPIYMCPTVYELPFILFDFCLFTTIFIFILNHVLFVTFWIFTYYKIWILLNVYCFIWNYWIIYFVTCFVTAITKSYGYSKWIAWQHQAITFHADSEVRWYSSEVNFTRDTSTKNH